MKSKPLNQLDFYKTGHRIQYPPNTSLIFSNFTPRSSRISGVEHVVFFGLQYFIKEYLIRQWEEGFFKRDKSGVLAEYKKRLDTSLGVDAVSIDHISALHDLGYLPIKIMALPEGSVVPIRVAPLVMWNTHEDFFWLTNYLETIISATLWQACNSATLAYEFRKDFEDMAIKTGSDMGFVQFQGHDFSFRGMSSLESACLSGAGHLLSFSGTDTVPAIDFLEEYYGADSDLQFIGGSIPATEHSVMCMGGKEDEIQTIKRILALYPTGPVSMVMDTWDYWSVLLKTLHRIKGAILARDGKLVIRPDSGDPVRIVAGYLDEELIQDPHTRAPMLFLDGTYRTQTDEPTRNISEAERKGSIKVLYELFGGTKNSKGYLELDSHIGLIYGDSITRERANRINKILELKGFASTNWVAGIGSYTYQYNTRDTFGWAMKATYGELKYGIYDMDTDKTTWTTEARELFKDPKTDNGVKKSAKGLIAVYQHTNEAGDLVFTQRDQVSWDEVLNCSFVTVFEDGKLLSDQTLEDIRKRLRNHYVRSTELISEE